MMCGGIKNPTLHHTSFQHKVKTLYNNKPSHENLGDLSGNDNKDNILLKQCN